jgi:hypothetical protein
MGFSGLLRYARNDAVFVLREGVGGRSLPLAKIATPCS